MLDLDNVAAMGMASDLDTASLHRFFAAQTEATALALARQSRAPLEGRFSRALAPCVTKQQQAGGDDGAEAGGVQGSNDG